jgi:endonuclease YncB( thermonuclease family)
MLSRWHASGCVSLALMIGMASAVGFLAPLFGIATADPIAPGAIEVIDGDTIRAHGRTVRLVGFDAPESGLRAQCETERTLAARATFRLQQLVSGGGLDLELIPCSCRAGRGNAPLQLRSRVLGCGAIDRQI